MADWWTTASSLATAGGTLVLAIATFSAVRSGSRSARVAEQALLVALRPLLVPSRLQDAPEKVHFADGKWLVSEPGGGAAEATDTDIYIVLSLRNVGTGIAVLHGWRFEAERVIGDVPHPDPSEFHRLTRDLYVPAGDTGFWQGALRDSATEEFAAANRVIVGGQDFMVDVMYGDHEGGQRMISRFLLTRRDDGRWLASAGRHWNLDRSDPR